MAGPKTTRRRVIVAAALAALFAGVVIIGLFTWRRLHGNHGVALAIPAGGSFKTGLAFKEVTLRIPPGLFMRAIEPPDFVAEADPPPGMTYEAHSKKLADEAKKKEQRAEAKFQQELKERTHEATLAIHIFEAATGNFPLDSKTAAAPPLLQLLDRLSAAMRAEGWKGAKSFFAPKSRAMMDRAMAGPEKAEEVNAQFTKNYPVSALFAVELSGQLFVSVLLAEKSPHFGHVEFCVTKAGDEYLLEFADNVSQEAAVLLHDLATNFLKNGNSIAPLKVK